jgi:hypothetical protein
MNAWRRLRDVFNRKSMKRAALAFAGAAAFSGGCLAAEQAPALQKPGCVTVQPHHLTPPQPAIPYDERLLRGNEDTPPSAEVLAMTPQARLQYYMDKYCLTADQAATDTKPGDRPIVSAISTLSGETYMGRPLIDFANQEHLKFCAIKHLPAGIGAQYESGDKLVVVSASYSSQAQVPYIAHELTHAAQTKNGLLTYYYDWDIQSRLRRNLVIEAAPIAMEYSVAYEKKLQGDDSYWEYLKKHNASSAYTNPDNYRLFDRTYKDSIASGATQNDALHAAAHVLFERVFQSDDWRRFYMTLELNSYISDIVGGHYQDRGPIQQDGFSQDKVDLAGAIGDVPSYTKGANVPSYDDFFKGQDQKMRWAYEAADLARYRQQFGADSPEAVVMETDAIHNKNPYLNLDMAELSRRLDKASWSGHFQTTWQVMDELLKDSGPVSGNCPAVPPKTPAVSAMGPWLR